MKMISKIFSAALMALAMTVPAQANELTIYDFNDVSDIVPIRPTYNDWAPHEVQFIYPASELTAMVGQDIRAMKFYFCDENGNVSGNVMNGGTYSISIGMTEQTTYASGWSASYIETGMTKVAEVTMNHGDTELVINFDNAWTYTGGNMVVQTVLDTQGTYSGYGYFLGQASGINNAVYGAYTLNTTGFYPKATFTYGEDTPVEMVYTVVGPESIFGSNWDTNDEKNELVKGENGVYTWSKEDVTLYGNFEFKVVGNHDYAIYEWPIGMNNWTAVLTEGEGIYTIEITFDPEAEDANKITCTLTKTGDIAPVEHVYTVAGTENLFGSSWDVADEANNLVKGENGIYTWTKENVEFALDDVVEFKIVQDHAWTYAWPSNNWWWLCQEAGTYNVVITFDPTVEDADKITFTATKADAPAGLRGDVNLDKQVNIADVTDLINCVLNNNWEGYSYDNADCDPNGTVNISDITALINYLLNNKVWPDE